MSSAIRILVLTAILCPALAQALSPEPQHLIYLHGKIIQERQDRRPEHPEYGRYELDAIADAFRARGFEVTAEVRPQPMSVGEAADETAARVRALLAAGVPAERITVAGASMGSWIALLTSVRLGEPAIRYVLLAPCASRNLRAVAEDEGKLPKGELLFIRDRSDVGDDDCESLDDETERTGLVVREVVIDTGLGHGFLYRPLTEWLEPTIAWAEGGRSLD